MPRVIGHEITVPNCYIVLFQELRFVRISRVKHAAQVQPYCPSLLFNLLCLIVSALRIIIERSQRRLAHRENCYESETSCISRASSYIQYASHAKSGESLAKSQTSWVHKSLSTRPSRAGLGLV
ncbi:hypothetical protein OPQ81_000591 [Rhizoctonia solani]|nr:hypothetical protein OPQ81_000591 [Rhizoctonia solani]